MPAFIRMQRQISRLASHQTSSSTDRIMLRCLTHLKVHIRRGAHAPYRDRSSLTPVEPDISSSVTFRFWALQLYSASPQKSALFCIFLMLPSVRFADSAPAAASEHQTSWGRQTLRLCQCQSHQPATSGARAVPKTRVRADGHEVRPGKRSANCRS